MPFGRPQKTSLVTETRNVLRQGILHGRWQFRLPGERKLCQELQVSRWTLRRALAALEREGAIRISHGHGSEILLKKKRGGPRAGEWRLGCILPEPLWKLRAFVALWIDALRVHLQELGGQLVLHDGARYYGAGGSGALAELTRQSPHDCWLLLLSNHEMQRWFYRKKLPVVVAGSSFEDALLPSVDLDLHAMGLHAGGLFLARGHRHVAILTSHKGYAGVMESERGLRDAIKASSVPGVRLSVEYHDGSPGQICRKLDKLRALANPPTAFFVQQSSSWLTVSGYMAQKGMLAPGDFSVILAQDEPYLSHLVPEPARYVVQPERFVRQVISLLQQARERVLPPDTKIRILPEFIQGNTLGRPPGD